MMIEKGIIKEGTVVFIYHLPVEHSLIGVVDNVNYPIISVLTIKRNGCSIWKKVEKIDISKDIPLTILNSQSIINLLTLKEQKQLKEAIKLTEMKDIFS